MKFTFSKPYYNVATEANTVALEEAYNVYFELMPSGGFAVRKRPGFTLVDTIDGTGQGVYWSDRKRKLYIVAGGKIYEKTSPTASPVLLGSVRTNNFPAVFAEGHKVNLDMILYVATDGALQYVDLEAGTLDTPASPPSATFVANLNNRFYANNLTDSDQDFWITDYNSAEGVNDPTFWGSSANPFRAAQKPDSLSGIFAAFNEVYIWGTQGCEVWQEDGVTPISPLVGSIIEAGLAAPYSVALANNTLFALATVAGKRAVISLNGRSPQILSEPIANKLQAMDVIEDAVGSLCFVGGLNYYILTFPTEMQTWAYDFKTETWSQWSFWNTFSGAHNLFKCNFGAYAKDWNKHYTLGVNGNLYEYSRDVYTDAGDAMRSSVRTGWIDHGTWDRKRLDQLIIKCKGYLDSTATLLMRMRDDGRNEWSNYMEFELEAGTQNDFLIKLNRLGTYRSRQYEFVMTDANNLALIGMEMDVTKMRF